MGLARSSQVGLRRVAPLLSALLVLVVGCTDGPSVHTTDPGTGAGGSGGSGGAATECTAGEALDEDGHCQPSGVPAELCPDGFAPNDFRGCDPILPAEPCASGEIAVPGDTECRLLAPCGSEPWAGIPVESNTQHVDGSYGNSDSDGTAERPWRALQPAIGAAEADAIVAIAAGSYPEDVMIHDKSVRLWGRCPELVELTGDLLWAVDIQDASGSEIHQLALTGPAMGLFLEDSVDVLIDRVWIHDTADAAVVLSQANTPCSLRIQDSLVEGAASVGVVMMGGELTVTHSVVRGSLPDLFLPGRGIDIQPSLAGDLATLRVVGSVVADNHEVGIAVFGSELTLTDSVVQDTQPREEDDGFGVGIQLQAFGLPAVADIEGSTIRRNHVTSLTVLGSIVTMRLSTIDDTRSQQSDALFGDGMVVAGTPLSIAELSIDRSAISHAARAGIANFSAVVAISGCALSCNPIDLDGETLDGPFTFDNGGMNACFCSDDVLLCKVLTSNLQAPEGL
ncbi:MAG: hypothetical protein DRI90_01900 [Deltaproteobacteria bacterium]|nr:MAG: hypothetical protein DRI90_01900 [Deltaproteobacteria bacterium]